MGSTYSCRVVSGSWFVVHGSLVYGTAWGVGSTKVGGLGEREGDGDGRRGREGGMEMEIESRKEWEGSKGGAGRFCVYQICGVGVALQKWWWWW